jgi:hypothetical protein
LRAARFSASMASCASTFGLQALGFLLRLLTTDLGLFGLKLLTLGLFLLGGALFLKLVELGIGGGRLGLELGQQRLLGLLLGRSVCR